mmetsp:Transcript_48008/g.128725  ORF Transcript_48008/g.128725 Transcript_48008/m.128725 type:complete len:268 (+) Transcript_48008:434-1237(+)
MPQDLLDRESLLRIHPEHAMDQVRGLRRKVAGNFVLPFSDEPEEVRVALDVEGKAAGQECVEDHATSPEVGLSAIIGAIFHEQLWGGIVRRADGVGQRLSFPELRRQAEIREFDCAILTEEYVLGLEVPMHHADAVAMRHALEDLPEEAPGLALAEPRVPHDVVEEVTAPRELEDDRVAVVELDGLNELEHVAVLREGVACDLLLQSFGIHLVLRYDLDRHINARRQDLGAPHHAELATAEHGAQAVLGQHGDGGRHQRWGGGGGDA